MRSVALLLFSTFLISIGLMFVIHVKAAPASTEEMSVTITYPTNKSKVGREVLVRGKALIPGGQYLWILARRTDFKPLWWPQREAEVDPTTGEWKAIAILGGPQDIGWEFDVGVIVVNSEGHAKLQDYWIKSMQSGDWRPIQIPKTTVAPQLIRVMKTSH